MTKWWIAFLCILILGTGFFAYTYAWRIAAHILPLIERQERVAVSPPSSFTVPEGYAVSIFADTVPGARVMTRDPAGLLVVSETSEDTIVGLPDQDGDGRADSTITILSGLNNPHGILFRCGGYGPTDSVGIDCSLYVAETDALSEYRYDTKTRVASDPRIIGTLPSDGGHSTRSLALDPDGKRILVSVGSSCNVCNEENSDRASILAFDLKTREKTIFAKGLRNTVFMARNYITGELWGTDMGRDLLGDDTPPDEINILTEGKNYGWPTCYGDNVHDTDFDHNTYIRAPCSEPFETPAHILIPAHSAPLGIAFVPEEGWPEDVQNDVLVAYHGSWNRTEPAGYKVVLFDSEKPKSKATDFMTGFITAEGSVIGRPAGLLAEPGGVLYVSDDRAGAIYRVTVSPAL